MPGSVSPPSPAALDAAAPSPVAVSGPAHLLRVTLLMAGSCLPILGAVLIAPVLPKMQDYFASTAGAKALVPLALTVPALSLALLAPFAGVIVDRLGRKRLLIVATALYAVFGTAPLWLDSLGAIIASRALVGVTEAAILTCCTTLVGDYYSGHQRVKYLALQTMCASASATAFFVVGGAVGAAGWRLPFWAYAVSLVLAPLMAAALPNPAPRVTVGDAAAGPEARPTRRPFPWRRLAGICAVTFFGAMVFYTVPVEMAYLLDDLGVENTSVIGLATAIASAATVAGAVAYMRGSGRVIRAGFRKIWGPGRHLAGDNTFTYFLDPHGNTVEYTTELELLDEDTWHPHVYDFSEPEVADQWGTANPMNELIAKESFNDVDRGVFVAPPV
jgi:MFS family permease